MVQESPAGRPSFNSIVKVLKDMAAALRPVKKPRPPSSAAASSYASQRIREPSPVASQQLPPEPESPAKPPGGVEKVEATPKALEALEEAEEASTQHQPAVSAFVAEAVQQSPALAGQQPGMQ